jgi:hypothetical protein
MEIFPIQKTPEETKFAFDITRGSSKDAYMTVRAIDTVTACKNYSARSLALPSTEFVLQPTRDATIMLSERFQRKPFSERDRE